MTHLGYLIVGWGTTLAVGGLYAFSLLRRGRGLTARVPAELAMQTGELSLDGAIRYLVDEVPLMEEDLARYDLSIYLRRPTYGMNYVMGKIQLEKLLSDRALQLGDDFDLGRFHDQFLAAGSIPISLIAWEMTGSDEEIRNLW